MIEHGSSSIGWNSCCNDFIFYFYSYRNLLDSLRLWNERAQLDVIMNHNKYAERPPQHIYISCYFCNKSISAYIQAPGRPRNPYARYGTGSATKSKVVWILVDFFYVKVKVFFLFMSKLYLVFFSSIYIFKSESSFSSIKSTTLLKPTFYYLCFLYNEKYIFLWVKCSLSI